MASRRVTLFAGRVLLVSVLALPRVVWAEPSAAQKETARNLMAEGRELREQRDLPGALARFQAAHAIMGVPTTGFELARAQADLKLLVEARTTIRQILATPAQAGEPEPFQEARSKAEALDAELEPRIASLHFVLHGAEPGKLVRLTVDGEVVAPAAVDMPFRLNPGEHKIEASAAHASAANSVTVAEHDTIDVVLDFEPDAKPPARTPSDAPSEADDGPPPLLYVAGGVAAAGLVVGTITGVMAGSKKHAAQAGCRDQQCPPSTWADLDSAHSLATVSTVGFIVAGVSIGVGVGSWLFSSSKPSPASIRAHVSVSHGVSSLDLTGSF